VVLEKKMSVLIVVSNFKHLSIFLTLFITNFNNLILTSKVEFFEIVKGFLMCEYTECKN
jgi:hypothetical protein